MLVTTENNEAKEARLSQNRSIISSALLITIRRWFDAAKTSTEAESWITIAREHGLQDLANEMKLDLELEILLTA